MAEKVWILNTYLYNEDGEPGCSGISFSIANIMTANDGTNEHMYTGMYGDANGNLYYRKSSDSSDLELAWEKPTNPESGTGWGMNTWKRTITFVTTPQVGSALYNWLLVNAVPYIDEYGLVTAQRLKVKARRHITNMPTAAEKYYGKEYTFNKNAASQDIGCRPYECKHNANTQTYYWDEIDSGNVYPANLSETKILKCDFVSNHTLYRYIMLVKTNTETPNEKNPVTIIYAKELCYANSDSGLPQRTTANHYGAYDVAYNNGQWSDVEFKEINLLNAITSDLEDRTEIDQWLADNTIDIGGKLWFDIMSLHRAYTASVIPIGEKGNFSLRSTAPNKVPSEESTVTSYTRDQ